MLSALNSLRWEHFLYSNISTIEREGHKDILKKGSKLVVRPFRKHIDAASILSLVWMLLWERTFKLAILFFYLCLFWISLQLFFIVGDCEVKSANPTVFLNFRRSASVTWTAVSGSEAVTADTKFWGKKKISGINHVTASAGLELASGLSVQCIWTVQLIRGVLILLSVQYLSTMKSCICTPAVVQPVMTLSRTVEFRHLPR